MRQAVLLLIVSLLAACSGHKPLPQTQAAVSIWDVSPMSSALRQSGGGQQYQFTATGPEHRGIASLRLFDPGRGEVDFFFPDFKALDNFSVAAREARFECGTQRLESGVQYACILNGKASRLGKGDGSRVAVLADGIRVTVPADLFEGGRPVQLQWLEYWR